MIGSTNAGGGALKFRVVGGTSAPVSPRENDIWVNTAVAITGYTLCAEQPTSPTEGLLWVQTGGSSAAAMAITRRNPVIVYPVRAQLYHSGVWTSLAAESYISGNWIAWGQYYLYNAGDECTSVTGGWSTAGGGAASSGWSSGTLTKAASTLNFACTYPQAISAAPANKTNFDTLTSIVINLDYISAQDAARLVICSARNEDWNPTLSLDGAPASAVLNVALQATGDNVIDVSSLSGDYYIKILCAGTNSVRVSSVRVE